MSDNNVINVNLVHVRQVIQELQHHRQLIDDAVKTLTSLEKAFGAKGVGNGAAVKMAKAPEPKQTAKNGTGPAAFTCAKHPHSREFSKRGQCKLCHSEYMKDYWSKKKKLKLTAVAALPGVKLRHEDDELDFVFSRQQRCPKCGLTTRFRRERDAGPTDNWVCLGQGCELKVANYKIAIDRDYEPSEDSLMQIS